jgi:transcriptional regulator with XRE-family HTH domain
MNEVKRTALEAFAKQLKAWRKQKGWTQAETGEKLGYSTSLVSGVETMDKNPTLDFATACDREFGTPGFAMDQDGKVVSPGTFLTLQELVSREAYPAFFQPALSLEREAARIHGWELGAIPGLLQTEDYARAQIRSGRPQDGDDAIERLVYARIDRQAVLTGDHPPMAWYVIDEGVLRHMVGGRAVMAAQLDRLLAASVMPGIVIQVLPFSGDNHAGSDGPITVYDFAERPTVCYTECYSGGRIVESRDEVAHLVTVLSLIRASSLSPGQSRVLIRQIRQEMCE